MNVLTNFTENLQISRQPVILGLTASAAFGKQKSKQNIILLNSTFYNLSSDIEFVEVSLKTARVQFFFLEDTRESLE